MIRQDKCIHCGSIRIIATFFNYKNRPRWKHRCYECNKTMEFWK